MDILEEIKEKLAKYEGTRYEITDSSVTVFPMSESGFDVSLFVDETAASLPYSVFFNGWHEEFPTKGEALDCFAFGLSSECRLKEMSLGGKPYKWTVEYRENDSWIPDSTTALFILSFWKPRDYKYLQNNLIQ